MCGGGGGTAIVRGARGGHMHQACYNALQLVRYWHIQSSVIVKEPLYNLCSIQTFTTMIHYVFRGA